MIPRQPLQPAALRAERRQGKRRYFKRIRDRRIFAAVPAGDGYFAIGSRTALRTTRAVSSEALERDFYEVTACKRCGRYKPLRHSHA